MTPIVCTTSVICPTPVGRNDSGRMSRLRSYFLTPINITIPVVSPDSLIMASANECVACLTTPAVKDFAWLGYMTTTSYNPDT
jgi:hypothetical protein